MVKVGYAEGTCPKCGKLLMRKRPADIAICDCYRYCQLCGKEMTSFTPDLTPSTYRCEEAYALKGQAVESPEWTVNTIMACYDHTPPYYSKQKPVEVHLQ